MNNEIIKKLARNFCICMTILIFFVIVICIVSNNTNEQTTKTKEAKFLIKENEHGENYPYTKDDLMVVCKKSAVWLQDSEGNEYALNGIAKTMLKDDKNYKGGTDLILKNGMNDLYTPAEAFEICVRMD